MPREPPTLDAFVPVTALERGRGLAILSGAALAAIVFARRSPRLGVGSGYRADAPISAAAPCPG